MSGNQNMWHNIVHKLFFADSETLFHHLLYLMTFYQVLWYHRRAVVKHESMVLWYQKGSPFASFRSGAYSPPLLK